MWTFYSILILAAWNVNAQQADISKILLQSLLDRQRQGTATLQTQFSQALPPAHSAKQQPSLPADGVYMWGEWGLFSECSVTCGRGIMRRQRTCYVYETSGRRANGGRSSTLQALLPLMLMSSAGGDSSSNMDLSTIFNMLGTRQGTGLTQAAPAQLQAQRQIGCPGDQIGGASCGGTTCPFPSTGGPFISMPSRPTVTIPPTALPPSLCLSQWGLWGQCSSSCGRAVRLRMRQCNCRDPISGFESCTEMLTMSEMCATLPPCLPLSTAIVITSPPTSAPTLPPVTTISGSWSSWNSWTICSSECGVGGSSIRRRRCTGSGLCYGKFQEVRQCPTVPCTPLPAAWGEWRAYGDCSTTCGIGEKSRTRDCSIRGACTGGDIETVPCILRACPAPAPEWSQWEAYSACSASCGKGVRSRSRKCPVEGQCSGDPVQLFECDDKQCPTFIPPTPTWSQWETYTVCSNTCGKGIRSRSRTCSVEGQCPDNAIEISECENGRCPTSPPPAPEWSQWEPYSICSASCGEGTKFRRRKCPVKGSCSGNAVEAAECIIKQCPTKPPPPAWSNWGQFSECSKTCGGGTQTRMRTCPVPDSCLGFGEEAVPCASNDCPKLPLPTWGTWSTYSACSKTCGVGQMTRNRKCIVPGMCLGDSEETRPCLQKLCPPTMTWSQWTVYGACTKTCGVGERSRRRTCPVSGRCPGAANEKRPCALQPCPTRGVSTWNPWSQYMPCSTTCGEGSRTRYRTCPTAGGCVGISMDFTSCDNADCVTTRPAVAQWGSWGRFSGCSVTCGVGQEARFRICPTPKACVGEGSEQRICTNNPCLACNFTAVMEREDCGFPGISRTACRERGCCYDDAQDGLIWCFYGNKNRRELGDNMLETDPDDQPDRA